MVCEKLLFSKPLQQLVGNAPWRISDVETILDFLLGQAYPTDKLLLVDIVSLPNGPSGPPEQPGLVIRIASVA